MATWWMSSVQIVTLQTGRLSSGVWRPTLHASYGVPMTNNGKPRPLVAIIGERLKEFREARELRQEDVAEAARGLGLNWGRSSVAALEGGARELKVEELFLLPSIIRRLGGWDKPFLPHLEQVRLSEDFFIQVRSAGEIIERLYLEPIHAKGWTPPLSEDEEAVLGAIETPPAHNSLENKQGIAREVLVFQLLLCSRWPERLRAAKMPMNQWSELSLKIAARLTEPDTGEAVDISFVEVLATGLWGRSAGEERDARADERGDYSSKRALQSARGHVTRELIEEMQAELESLWPEYRQILADLESVIDDEEKLDEWSSRVRTKWEETRWPDMAKKPRRSLLGRRGGKRES